MSETALLMRSLFYVLYVERFKSNTSLTLDLICVINLRWLILYDNMTGPRDTQIAG